MTPHALKKPVVSVIMPAYNVAPYLLRAVESLQRQTLENFELLLVDDGSSDDTPRLADRLAEKDLRIEVFHQQNAGAPAARNFALEKASGTFVYFMDADDWAEPTMLTDMVELAQTHELELVVTGFFIDTYYNNSGQYLSEYKGAPDTLFEEAGEFRKAAWRLFDQNLLYTPWNKLFARERIMKLHLRFKNTFWDDFPFVLDYIRDVERVGILAKGYYHFVRQRKDSETSRWREDMYAKREEEHEWMLDLYKHWGRFDEKSVEMLYRRYIERVIGCVESICSPECPLPRQKKLEQIKLMTQNENVERALTFAKPRSKMMSCMLVPLKSKNLSLTFAEGRFISFVKRHNTKLFASLKARR